MSCEDIKLKLLDYAENSLDDNQYNEIKQHIENCPSCQKEYEEILDTLLCLKEGFDNIDAPEGFMEGVKCRIEKQFYKKPRIRKSIKTAIIAAALTVAFTVTGFATNGFSFIKLWQDISLKQSQSIEQLISNGYGEHVNISSEDKNIKITIENVVADDSGTIVSYSIEDLDKKNTYMLDYKNGTSIEGEFNYPFEGFTNPLKGDSILYSSEPYIQKGMFRLDPVKTRSSTVSISINKLNFGDKEPLSTIEGSWKFNIPVTKHESFTYMLDKEAEIDGNKVVFNKLTVAPTNTALTYSYYENQNPNYTIKAFSNIKLISSGKQYDVKYMGSSSSKVDSKGNNEITLEFDSMYLDNPKEVTISIGSYLVRVHKYADYDVDVNKPFPQVFEYFGSKISIDSISVGDKKTELAVSHSFQEKQYESLEMEFYVKGHPLAYTSGSGQSESYALDKNGKRVEIGAVNGPLENIQPKYYITNQHITIQDSPGIEKLPNEYHDGDLIPEKLIVEGYQETRYVNRSFNIKLDK